MKRCAIRALYCTMINYHGAALGPPLCMHLSFTGGCFHSAALICVMELKEKIGYNYSMQKWVEKNAPCASCTALAFIICFYYSLRHRILTAVPSCCCFSIPPGTACVVLQNGAI